MATDSTPFVATFRCFVCHNRTGLDYAHAVSGLMLCTRCVRNLEEQAKAEGGDVS